MAKRADGWTFDFSTDGEFVAGEARFAGSVRTRTQQAVLEVLARELADINDAERAGYVLDTDELAMKARLATELEAQLAPEDSTAEELQP